MFISRTQLKSAREEILELKRQLAVMDEQNQKCKSFINEQDGEIKRLRYELLVQKSEAKKYKSESDSNNFLYKYHKSKSEDLMQECKENERISYYELMSELGLR